MFVFRDGLFELIYTFAALFNQLEPPGIYFSNISISIANIPLIHCISSVNIWTGCPRNSPDEIIKRGQFPLCEGNHRSPVNSPHREPATRVYFLYQSRQTIKQTVGLPVIWDDRCSLWRYCNVLPNRCQRCNFCSKVTTKPCNIKLISTLGTLLGAIECVVVVLAFQ